jgi:ABC-type antimicrobial peptide transport system permease subunit
MVKVELLTKVLLSVISICSALITAYVVPYVKSKISANEFDTLTTYISCAVRCAEQIYTKEEKTQKKDFVIEYARNILNEKLHLDISYEELDTLVEGIVNEIKHCDKNGTLVDNKENDSNGNGEAN